MTRKQTSAKVSKLAAKYLAMDVEDLMAIMVDLDRRELAKDIRTLAASCLSQDEVKGDSPAQRRKKAKLLKVAEMAEEHPPLFKVQP